MPWVRRRYRGNKVYVETDDAGAPVLDARGFARLRYKPDDDRTYTVRPREVLALDDETPALAAPAPAPDTGPVAPPDEASPRARTVRTAAAPDADDPDLAALAGRELQAWTDGASSGNPGPSGAGVVLLFRDHRKEVALWLGETTNNVAELTAVREALRLVRRRDLPVRVLTDSTYVIGVLSGSMRAKANADLIAEIRNEMREFENLTLTKVEAHAGVVWNERADALARQAIKARRTTTTEVRGTAS